jgi:uncharacterized protein YndB with AHSA1/START domain
LLIADIGGFTEYVGGVELDHASDVLASLLQLVVDQTRGSFELANLEGDAVFAHASGASISGGTVLSSVEAAYFAFMERLQLIDRESTCPCDACRRVPTLSLKFVVHHGEYARHRVADREELVGRDVNVAHRLLKNTVAEKTGLRGYALLTQACVDHLGLQAAAAGLLLHHDQYDDVGSVDGHVLDLERQWEAEQERRVVYVGPGEGDSLLGYEFETAQPPAVVWEHLTSPAKQVLWHGGGKDWNDADGKGLGAGSTMHCVHGPRRASHHILTWRPHRFLTYRTSSGPFRWLRTDEITPLASGGSLVSHRAVREGGRLQRIVERALRRRLRSAMADGVDRLRQLLDSA